MTTLDYNSHYDVYSHIWLPHFSCINNPIFWSMGKTRLLQEVTWFMFKLLLTHFPLGTETVISMMGFFLFFSQKNTIEVLFTWSDSFPPFLSPLPGSLEIAKKPKVPHADAESSLDVLGVWLWVHECACHKRKWPSTSADPKWSCLL